MKKVLMVLATGGLICTFATSTALADSHEEGGLDHASPIELFACSYNEGKGPADLDKAVDGWNQWADKHNQTHYSAWTLVPYYSSPEQEFDVLWLGGAPNAASLGRGQDLWLATGGNEAQGFNEALNCTAHSNFATLQFKKPPERENPNNIVVSFSDCNMADGVVFDDLVPSLMEWAKYRESEGSKSGMWVLFPAYGGGGEDFDFKFVASWQNLEEQGVDYDQYNQSGWKKGNELFQGKLDCDSSRVYLGTNRRMGAPDSG
ncbi:MAG: hypothetical protein HKN57_03305 [Xanthomonadales bacterium]|nr:hypothetical protein [Gammaproteobacteria bacterium]MBT8053093.1 hypothetical protein [Gammaproteobacteria bacterium]NND56255.1 hypothetical protein [Xanthomonadales bacterium]NNK52330.1 hypothetical protein [Xanthomonadales bacterium]